MNRLIITGNCTKDPELRTTPNGKNVCTFTVAVNRKKKIQGQPEADFFRVTAWRQLGENCAKFLSKGRKVCAVGPVSVSTYTGNDGVTRANLEVTAEDVEFLSPKEQNGGYTQVAPADNPFDQDVLPI
jgi:single-strand DNA-binding protein